MSNVQHVLDAEAERVTGRLVEFLENFESEADLDEMTAIFEYLEQLETMKSYGKTTLFVDFTHILQTDAELANLVISEFYRFEPALRRGVQRFVQKHKPGYEEEEGNLKEFYISFYNLPICNKLRDMRAERVGQLVAVSGVVTRTSEVRPELLLGSFTCLECGLEHKDVAQQFKYTEPIICRNATCSNRDKWKLDRQNSKFVDWQRVRLQESSDEVPAGSLPRTLDVILRHEIVEQARAGDKCIFTGTLVVVPDVGAFARSGEKSETIRGQGDGKGDRGGEGRSQAGGDGVRGLKALGVRELNYKLAFLASSVQSYDNEKQLVNIRAEEEEEIEDEDLISPEDKEDCEKMRDSGNFYEKIISSICPTVFGHFEIKRAIALMLFGGCHKKTSEGINLRGDINVCIVGDPSCAKSQFLKYVSKFVPRAVYTSGKSSSAAGLTASVVKEPETGEFCIEAGALMLADNGICCIDEFDKMDIKDQVAIHEAMEQQTISITKAGIQATLNARTSILAAANPTAGRYDKSKPLKYNVNLPPAILSRFDLVHVMVDEPESQLDEAVARHIVNIHQKRDDAVHPEFSTVQLQKYIKYARTLKPQLTPASERALVEAYVSLRRGDAAPGSKTAYRITVRQLEALIRLSEALARLHLSENIEPGHVREAKRLLSTSIVSVDTQNFDLEDEASIEKEFEDFGEDLTPHPTNNVPAFVLGDGGRERRDLQPEEGKTSEIEDAEKIVEDGENKEKEKVRVQVSYDKFQQVSRSLAEYLRQKEKEAEQSGTEEVGIKQGDLVRWYVSRQNELGVFSSTSEVVQEYRLVRSIIQHLVKKEGVLLVLDDGEAAAAAVKQANEAENDTSSGQPSETVNVPLAIEHRVLALNPNYVFE